MIFIWPTLANAFNVVWTNPNYSSNYWRTPDPSSKSMAFDQNGNFYTESVDDNGSGTVQVYVNETSLLPSYTTPDHRVTGLATNFNDMIYISESDQPHNTGQISTYNLTTNRVVDTLLLDLYRPTGVAYNPVTATIFFTAKRDDNSSIGGVYEVLSDGTLQTISGRFKGTGIAIDHAGNFFVSTGGDAVSGFQNHSIYRFNSSFRRAQRIATFNSAPDELTFDNAGTLYAIGKVGEGNEIFQFNLVPIPGAVWLLGTGLFGILGLRKTKFFKK